MNFSYLKKYPRFNRLRNFCEDAESFVIAKPSISATSARKAMEFIVKFLYTGSLGLEQFNYTVFEMLTDPRFISYVDDSTLINTLHYIRKMGNVAAHGDELTRDEGLKVLEELHFLVGEFCILIGLIDDYPVFIKPGVIKKTEEDAKKVVKKEKIVPEPELIAEYAPRMRAVRFNTSFQRDESENRKMFLEASLREAGWKIVKKDNQSMPGAAGINMIIDDGSVVDYTLYGNDNKPIAIIIEKLASQNIVKARLEGIRLADQMSKSLGYKPLIYYTTGYNTYFIDQLGYPPRRVFQFHTIEELELLKLRSKLRKDITNPKIDDNITNRDYQKEAIRATCDAFNSKRRHSLLVMATGTGKTRVSISIVDILMKSNWVKNVLFLADRTSLVKQAHKNFNKLLPQVTTAIYAGNNDNKDPNARIIFSTYQSMINLINDDTREFTIGRFDLIIIDEAHRSIFNRYGALFHYFDALMVGLTATPRNEENRSTYEMFQLNNGEPDYAYELEQAIGEGYLVGFSVMDKTTAALKNNQIHYDDLSDEEKQRFEDTFSSIYDSEEVDFSGTIVSNGTVNTGDSGSRVKVINLGTIDAMLNDIMKNSLKIEGGDKIGKTIIFSKNHFEAEQIVLRFQKLYSYLGDDFCKLIDSQTLGSQGLIERFENRDDLPQIAVSVDMLDTGIDVPDILNLVFFKQVHSKIKFLQMIGRGTRLSPDIFGPGLDKKGFLILDYYNNFNYFRTNNTWSTLDETGNSSVFNYTPQRVLLSRAKLGILRTLTEADSLTPFEIQYRDELKQEFISKVRGLCNDDVEVQYHMAYVNKYRAKEYWDTFTDDRVEEIDEFILPLLPPSSDSVKVKNFDLLMYVIEDQIPKRMAADADIRKIKHGFSNVGTMIDRMLKKLISIKTIPDILKKEKLINQMRNADLVFDNFSYELCEYVRKELRDLMNYIPDEKEYYLIRTDDYVIDISDVDEQTPEKSYAEKAREYVAEGSTSLAKIRNLDELNKEEFSDLEEVFYQKLGTKDEFLEWSQNKPLLTFLRIQVGISEEAIDTKFGSFMNSDVLDEPQLTYMNQIISYARENGDITFMDLQRVSPFCDIDIMNLFGTKIEYIKLLINGIHNPVMKKQ